ncbi:UDP-3-O-(3-hydroxymyristoyl)glucosamine N-acyltransferase [Aquirhabdus sp.]|uniref:UDP-3-O-(3-hydroxymyristoyl)glucosamine N-acyltransferase n=1 Tax=Aquirhabdus sp. TaxID=2824160 RepID=UPI00396C8DA0
MSSLTLGEIVKHLNQRIAEGAFPLSTPAAVSGDESLVITGLASLSQAGPTQLSFLANSQYRGQLQTTGAGAMILTEADREAFVGSAIVVSDPYYVFAQLTHLFDPFNAVEVGIHPTAVVSPHATIGENVSIGPFVVIEDHAQIGDGAVLISSVHIGRDSVIGNKCWLGHGVTIHHGCILGQRTRIHAGAVIGAEGFGFATAEGRWHRIVQLGRVVIGDDVRIGANTTIDRGALDDTIIADGVIIDNQVQIAHNVKIGAHTALAAGTGVAGSTTIGSHCILGGLVGVAGHLEITDRVHITAMSMITRSIKESGSYSSGSAFEKTADWRKSAVRVRHLGEMAAQIKGLQLALERLELQLGNQ